MIAAGATFTSAKVASDVLQLTFTVTVRARFRGELSWLKARAEAIRALLKHRDEGGCTHLHARRQWTERG